MKKLVSFVLVAALLASLLVLGASAESTSYRLDELGLSVEIPDKYAIITRDTPEGDPIYDLMGVSKSEIDEYYRYNYIYLHALTEDLSEEILVTMAGSVILSFRDYSDSVLLNYVEQLKSVYDNLGATITDSEIYDTEQTRFVKIYFENKEDELHGVQYFTTFGSKEINFSLRSLAGPVSAEQEETLKKIIDSVVFDTAPAPEAGVQSNGDPSSYTDLDTGIIIDLPENWVMDSSFVPSGYVEVAFDHASDSRKKIYFGSIDLWSILGDNSMKGTIRAEFNSSFLPVENVALMFNVDSSMVKEVTYNGADCYLVTVRTDLSNYGIDTPSYFTYLLYVDNGWGYFFAFSGTETDEFFADFEELLNSVDFPKTQSTLRKVVTFAVVAVTILLFLAIIFVIVMIVVIIKKVIKKHITPHNEIS